MNAPDRILNARLPRWLLAPGWPERAGEPVPALLTLAAGRIDTVAPMDAAVGAAAAQGTRTPQDVRGNIWDVRGAPVLPGLVDAHTHLDKTFTLPRIRDLQPGLLGAINAMMTDRQRWTAADIHQRASQALAWAHAAGCVHVRSHVDWWEAGSTPLAWNVLAELAGEWRGRIQLEQVSLIKLTLFEDLAQAHRFARQVRVTGPHALLGAFVHTVNWNPRALRNVFIAAEEAGLDVDLHVDEELDARAEGLAASARIVREIGFSGRVVCGHSCALAAQPDDVALATLDAVAQAPITLISLPITNLLLQDAATGRTPRQRGVTLVNEARARGIPVLLASDNVQDPFCQLGSYDPVEALSAGVLAAQLGRPFDDWSDSLCRRDWLQRAPSTTPSLIGAPADLVIFGDTDAWGWPARAARRTVLRGGIPLAAPPQLDFSATRSAISAAASSSTASTMVSSTLSAT